MPQQPTSSDPNDVVKSYKGLNDQKDSIARPKGSSTAATNVYDDQAGDVSRRAGRDFIALETGAALGVFDLNWDDGSITNITLTNGAGKYSDFTYPDTGGGLDSKVTNPSIPGPMIGEPSFLPVYRQSNTQIPDLVPAMRALSSARMFVNGGTDNLGWRDRIWKLNVYDRNGNLKGSTRDKNQILGAIANQQAEGYRLDWVDDPESAPTPGTTIPLNFYWADYYNSKGLIVDDVNNIISKYNSVVTAYLETNPYDGASSLSNFSSGTTEVATFATWKSVMARVANLINTNLLRVQVTTGWTSIENKNASNSFGVPGSCPGHVPSGPLLNQYTVSGGPMEIIVDAPTCVANADYSLGAWNGIVSKSTIPCEWSGAGDSWEGKGFNSAVLTLGTGYWNLLMLCSIESGPSPNVYRKSFGSTPVGTYTAVDACVVPQTITVS